MKQKLTYYYVLNRIKKVFMSCKTHKQIKVADKYCELLIKYYSTSGIYK
jgi:hypothetical protein